MKKPSLTRELVAVMLMVSGVLALAAAAFLAFGVAAFLATVGAAAIVVALLIGWSR